MIDTTSLNFPIPQFFEIAEKTSCIRAAQKLYSLIGCVLLWLPFIENAFRKISNNESEISIEIDAQRKQTIWFPFHCIRLLAIIIGNIICSL